jgi:hypothetical protein
VAALISCYRLRYGNTAEQNFEENVLCNFVVWGFFGIRFKGVLPEALYFYLFTFKRG